MSFINSFFEKKGEHAQRLFFDIRFLFFGFTLISSLGFLIMYSFLYGYYFSGNEMFQISNFNIVSNLIPFSIQTLTVTSIFFICIYYIISAAIPLILKNKEKKGAIVILLVLIIFLLNLFITMFFANEMTFISMLSFSLIWVFIGFVVCFLYTIIIAEEHPFIMINGVMFQFILLPLIGNLLSVMTGLEENKFIEVSTILFIPSLFITIKISCRYHNKKWFDFISYLPVSVIISYLIFLNLAGDKISLFSKIMTFILINLIIHFAILKMVKSVQEKIEEKVQLVATEKVEGKQEEIKENPSGNKSILYIAIYKCYGVLSNKVNNVSKLLIGLALLFAFVCLPRISLLSGQSIRMINQAYEKPIEIIYVDQSGQERNLVGNYYIENNLTLYIANKCWELEIIKPVNYHIKSVNKEDEENKENKEMCKNQNWFNIFVK